MFFSFPFFPATPKLPNGRALGLLMLGWLLSRVLRHALAYSSCVLGLPMLAGLGRCAVRLCNETKLPQTGLAWRGLAAVRKFKLFGQGGLCSPDSKNWAAEAGLALLGWCDLRFCDYSLCVLGHDANGMGSN